MLNIMNCSNQDMNDKLTSQEILQPLNKSFINVAQ